MHLNKVYIFTLFSLMALLVSPINGQDNSTSASDSNAGSPTSNSASATSSAASAATTAANGCDNCVSYIQIITNCTNSVPASQRQSGSASLQGPVFKCACDLQQTFLNSIAACVACPGQSVEQTSPQDVANACITVESGNVNYTGLGFPTQSVQTNPVNISQTYGPSVTQNTNSTSGVLGINNVIVSWVTVASVGVALITSNF